MSEAARSVLSPGARVRIDRDETLHPARGTWPQFRGRIGTVVEVNHDRTRPGRTEYGVVFGKVRYRSDRPGSVSAASGREPTTWFKAYELTPMGGAGSQRATDGRPAPTETNDLQEAAA